MAWNNRPGTGTARAGLTVLVLAAVLFSGVAGLRAQAPAGPRYAGKPLAEALLELEALGLKVVFTSNLVRPEMRVAVEPTATDPRRILDELLAPHGLTAEAGPGSRLVVVPRAAPPPAAVRGLVRDRRTREPLEGVLVLIPDTGREVVSAADGSFLLADVAAGTWTLEARLPGYVVQRLEVTVAAGQAAEALFDMEPAPVPLDEIIVTPSLVTLLREDPVAAVALDRDEILALPHIGDDVFRSLTLLPGVSGAEISAQFNVRGGRTDEVLVMLDRVELFEPYHLKDFSSALSIIAPKALAEVDLITGGFPAEYGDRMSGVLEMDTLTPDWRARHHLGLSVLSAEVGTSGAFADGRGHWLGVVRRGSLDLTLEFLGKDEKPSYWDAFGKLHYQVRPGQTIGVHVLSADDDLAFTEVDVDEGAIEGATTGYGNSYAWLSHQGLLGSRLFVDTLLNRGRVDRDRRGAETEPEEMGFTLRDERVLDVTGFKQDWNLEACGRHYLKWGFETRRFEVEYDYVNLRMLEDPLAEIRSEPRTGITRFREDLRGRQVSAYASDRLRPWDDLTVELGLRWDRHTLTDDRHLSPRFNLVQALGRASTLRLAWGYFYQSQRPYELRVEDGEDAFVSAERTEHRVIGFEHAFAGRRGLRLRAEAYQRLITDPRVRYENLFEPVSKFPEIEPDRFRYAPDQSKAWGVELYLRGQGGPRVDWWANYAYARVEDSIDGSDVPRSIDQPHTFNFDVNVKLGEHWNLNLAWRYHSGWPTTALSAELEEDDEGELEAVPVFGPINGERLTVYHRLDLRASRDWQLKKGELVFFVDVQNVYDRENVAGFDVDFEFLVQPDGTVNVVAIEEIWGGFLPSFGITWEF